jgi:hypothetical protein
MENQIPIHLQELIYASRDPNKSRELKKLEEDGIIKKISPRIYTTNLTETPESIIRRNIFQIIAKLYPGALLSHRSALEYKPTETGNIFLTYTYTKKIKLPGITINFLEGSGAIDGDHPFAGKLFSSQKERALLENLQSSRKTGSKSKIISIPEIEEKLEQIIQVNGEECLNAIRDRARKISEQLNMYNEFDKLNRIISSLLTTNTPRMLKSPLAVARAFGVPYDSARLELFQTLYRALQLKEFSNYPEENNSRQAFRNFAFFEAYFSNYIEGTEFEIEDAKRIIETQMPIPTRNEDSHDVLGTYQLVSNQKEMSISYESPEDFINIISYRHKILLSSRKNKKPGEFKDRNNRAGDTYFVDFKLVRGTLIKGLEFQQSLNHPFSKAAYMMFLISEVHPFLDGNGRIARVMMNSELVKAGQSKIIIPTVYRDDYMGALRKLTRQSDPDPYIRMLQRAHEFSKNIFGEDMSDMEKYLKACNAFKEHTTGQLKITPHN